MFFSHVIIPLVKGAGGCSIGFDVHNEQVKSLPFLMEHPPTPFTRGMKIDSTCETLINKKPNKEYLLDEQAHQCGQALRG